MLGDTNSGPSVRRRLLHEGRKFNFEMLTISEPGKPTVEREVVRHPGAVIVLPIAETAQGQQIIMIRNWRLSVEDWMWELPAGTLEKGEDPLACAGRELQEETGYSAATLRPLCRFHTSPGMSDELMWAFVATGLSQGSQQLEVDERVTVHAVPAYQCVQRAENGEMTDAKSMLVLLLALRKGLIRVSPTPGA